MDAILQGSRGVFENFIWYSCGAVCLPTGKGVETLGECVLISYGLVQPGGGCELGGRGDEDVGVMVGGCPGWWGDGGMVMGWSL